MNRGDVWWVEFSAHVGGEIQKDRPCAVVSGDMSNKHMNRIQVVPLTTKVDKVFASEALVRVRGRQHKAMADQIATVSKVRVKNRIGRLSPQDMKKVEEAIKIQLDLH